MLDTIQKRIIALREARGLTKRQVADAIGERYTSYCHYEDGSMEIRASVLYKLSIFYNQSADWICGLDEIEKSAPPESRWDAIRSIIERLPENEIKELQAFVHYLEWKVNEREKKG